MFFSISVCCRWDSQFVILHYLLKDSFSTHENKFCKLWQARATFYILAMSDMFVCLYVSVFVRLCIQLFIVFVPCLEILCVVLGGCQCVTQDIWLMAHSHWLTVKDQGQVIQRHVHRWPTVVICQSEKINTEEMKHPKHTDRFRPHACELRQLIDLNMYKNQCVAVPVLSSIVIISVQ